MLVKTFGLYMITISALMNKDKTTKNIYKHNFPQVIFLLVHPNAPHAYDYKCITCDYQQVNAEEKEVQDVSHVAPLVL